MSPSARRAGLVAHIGVSVGWLGAVVTSLVLGVAAVSAEPPLAHACFVTLEIIGEWALVPFSVLSLMTGVIQALGTRWGLWRHYWVVIKLALTVTATAVLLLYTRTLDALAVGEAGASTVSPIVHAAGALLVLGAALVLSVVKPRGLTRRGRQRSVPVSSRSAIGRP